ncbi:hypothetical protein J4G33_01340 [Actinotalea sp. BY-33]|uniref:MarR family transcriptional regulator n=1 Tax=Actinotalea soli TaxID=2819234 RepID=A0A939RUB0_9CELL|nr:hypothetical protein [Actinotalea soli]MBO1750443.1 hypothetical protein [Actinotalea soli]
MFVLTIDQQGSRRVGDRVEQLLSHLEDRVVAGQPGVVRPFERTVGDEVQAVLDDPRLAVETALEALRLGEWTVGVGAGPVDEPLPTAARAGSGPAFVLAREAVERAKSRARPVPIAVEATHALAGADCEAVLTLVGAIMARRTEQGWAVIDTLTALGDATQDAVADRLGITQQAVSQRLRTALWAEELAVRPAAARLLAEGDA